MKDHRETVVCDFQNKATVDQTVVGLQTTMTQTSQMKILHSLKQKTDICYPKQLIFFQSNDSSLGFSVLVSPGSFTQRYYVPCHYKICCVFKHSGSGSLDVGTALETSGARGTAKISKQRHKTKHCFDNLYGY